MFPPRKPFNPPPFTPPFLGGPPVMATPPAPNLQMPQPPPMPVAPPEMDAPDAPPPAPPYGGSTAPEQSQAQYADDAKVTRNVPDTSLGAPPTAKQRWIGSQPPPLANPQNAANGAMQLPSAPQPRNPGILQRLGAVAMGAATGYVNAAGRSRIDPETAQAAKQGILHPGYAAQMGNYQRQVQQIQAQSQLNSDAAKDSASLENAASNKEAREAIADQRRAKPAADAAALKEKTDVANAARLERLWKLQTDGRNISTTALPGWQPAKSPDGVNVYLSPSTKTVPKELVEFIPGSTEGMEIDSKSWDAAANDYRATLKATKIQDNAPEKVKDVNAVQLAIRAAGGDPSDPKSITPDIAKKASAILKPPSASGGGGVQLTPEALDYWAKFAGTTGQTPALGMGASNNPTRAAILNRAPQVAGGDVAANRAVNRSDSGSLASMQKMRDSVVAFESTATKNLDIFLNSAKPVIDSGSPLINQPLRAINKAGLGSAELAAYDAARRVAINEIAKVTNNPSLAGQLSDSARHEVESLIPEQATLAQIYAVANVLKQDMANRHTELDRGIAEIKGRLGGGAQVGPKVGDTESHNGDTYKFDGKQWVKQAKANGR